MDGYCVKCGTMKEMANATETRSRDGKPEMIGTCVTCGARIYKRGGIPVNDPAPTGASATSAGPSPTAPPRAAA